METKTPERRHLGSTRIKIELLNSCFSTLLTKEKSKIKNTTYNFIGYKMFSSSCWLDDIHSIWTSEIVNME